MSQSMYPTSVDIKAASVEKLTKILKQTYKDVTSQISTATDFGVNNRRVILSQIEAILEQSGVDVQQFVADEMPGYYRVGADYAVKQLKNANAEVPFSSGFSVIHRDALQFLIDDTTQSMFEALTGVKRSADLLLGRATRELVTQQIATGQVAGTNLKQVAKTIKGTLVEQGLDALVDKSGKGWSLDTYAEMLFRTKVVQARNYGFANRLVENGYDLVQVSNHSGACRLCEPWQGKILSLGGKTPGYPTLAQAESDGLFHPNCRHAINAITPSLANKTRAYDPEKRTLTEPGTTLQKPVFEAVDKVVNEAKDYDSTFKDKISGVAQAAGYEFRGGPVKTAGRATEKIINDYNGDIGAIKDINRGVIFIDDPAKLNTLVTQIKKVYEVDRVKNDFGDFIGYQKAMINVKLPTGAVAEVQVTTKEFWTARKELGGHKLYQVVRANADGWQEAEKQMTELYSEAKRALDARLSAVSNAS